MNTRLHRPLITLSVLALSIAILAGCYPPAGLLPGGTGNSAGGEAAGTPAPGGQMPPLVPFGVADWQLVAVGGAPAVARRGSDHGAGRGEGYRHDRLQPLHGLVYS